MAFENGVPADVLHNIFISVFAKSLPLFVMGEQVHDVRYILNTISIVEGPHSELKVC